MNPFLQQALAGGVQRTKPTSTLGFYDQGLTDALRKGVGAGYVGLNVGLPIVQNNMQYAPEFIAGANAVSGAGNFLGDYTNYQTALGLMDPSTGSQAFGSALGLGSLGNQFIQGALMSNPVTGSLNILNQLTANQKNPYGGIPLVSDFSEFISNTARGMNNSPIGRGISDFGSSVYGNTVGRLTNNAVGRGLFQTASIPFSGAEGLFGLIREGYQGLDRGLFNNKLPAGADADIAETQQFDNPFQPMLDAIKGVPDSFRTEEKIDLDAQYDTLLDTNEIDSKQKGAIDKMIESGVDRYDAIDKTLNTTPLELANFLGEQAITQKEVNDIASTLSGRSIDDLNPQIIDQSTGMFVEPEVFFDPTYNSVDNFNMSEISNINSNVGVLPESMTTALTPEVLPMELAGQPSAQDFVDMNIQQSIVDNAVNRVNQSVMNNPISVDTYVNDFVNDLYSDYTPTFNF
jgi:hypothetical protein